MRTVMMSAMLIGLIFSQAAVCEELKEDRFNAAAAKRLTEAGVDKIAFVKRGTYTSSHYYTDFIGQYGDTLARGAEILTALDYQSKNKYLRLRIIRNILIL